MISREGYFLIFSGSEESDEALSRGAKEAYFVEKAKPALRCIRENLRYTKLDKKAQVLATDVNSAIRQLEHFKNEAFDHIFMDPPYKKDGQMKYTIIDRTHLYRRYSRDRESSLRRRFQILRN